MSDAILSTVRRASTERLVYSSLHAFGSRRGGELPGTWFVRAFGDLGRAATGVRQTLYRMEASAELESRKLGRNKLYRLSAFGEAAAEAGGRKIFEEPADAWDGEWTLIRYQFAGADRLLRDRARQLLELEGFASLDRGLYIHPRDRSAEVLEGLSVLGQSGDILAFRGARLGGESDRDLVARLWDLADLDREYRSFLKRYQSLALRHASSWKPRDAFLTRLAVVLDYLRVAWRDPELPSSLVPLDWRGPAARSMTRRLYETLLPAMLQYSDTFLESPRPTGASS